VSEGGPRIALVLEHPSLWGPGALAHPVHSPSPAGDTQGLPSFLSDAHSLATVGCWGLTATLGLLVDKTGGLEGAKAERHQASFKSKKSALYRQLSCL
jgi:hypothetical protein